MQQAINTEVNIPPRPARRYAEAAAEMRAVGIDIRDDEYERIDLLADVQDAMFLHLCGIAPFVARVVARKC